MEDSTFDFQQQRQKRNYDDHTNYTQILQDKGFESSSSNDTSFRSIVKNSAVEVNHQPKHDSLFGFSDIGDDSDIDETIVQPKEMVRTMVKVDDLFSTDEEQANTANQVPTLNFKAQQLKKTTPSLDSEPTIVIPKQQQEQKRRKRSVRSKQLSESETESVSEESEVQQRKHRKRRSKDIQESDEEDYNYIQDNEVVPVNIHNKNQQLNHSGFQEFVQLNTVQKNKKQVQETKAAKVVQQQVKTKKGIQKELDSEPKTIEVKRNRKTAPKSDFQNAVRVQEPIRVISNEEETAQKLAEILKSHESQFNQSYQQLKVQPTKKLPSAKSSVTRSEKTPEKFSYDSQNAMDFDSPEPQEIAPEQKLQSPKLPAYSQNLVSSLNINELDGFQNSHSINLTKPQRKPKKNLSMVQSSNSVPDTRISTFSVGESAMSQSIINEYNNLYDSVTPKAMLNTIQVEQSMRVVDPLESYFEKLNLKLPGQIANFTSKKTEMIEFEFAEHQIPVNFGKKFLPPVRKILGEKLIYSGGRLTALLVCFEKIEVHSQKSKLEGLMNRKGNKNAINLNQLQFASSPMKIAGISQFSQTDVKCAILKEDEKSERITAKCDFLVILGMGELKVKKNGEDQQIRCYESYFVGKGDKIIIQGVQKENLFWVVE